jgi:hypothetical protein
LDCLNLYSMYLYYSPNCKHCARLIQTYDFSKFQCVDVHKYRVPPNVTSVPTIVDDADNAYVGSNTFRFMEGSAGIQPYSFDVTNLTNKGFSYIDKDPLEMFYCENSNYTEIN